MITEFRASPRKTLPIFLVLLAAMASFAFGAASTWSNPLVSGALLVPAALCLIGAGILGYRLLARPVMLRIGPEGIYMKRLGVTLPWDALARIERTDWQGQLLFALIPAEGDHPVLEERTLLLGAALNKRLSLPDLAVQMAYYDGTPEAFETAIKAAGGPEIVDAAGQDSPV